MNPTRRSFGTKEDLALALAETVAEHLNDGIASRGKAVLAVSGGSTPARFFSVLSRRRDIPWENVIVTLVDERWVPETSDRSNAGLVNEKLLQGPAASAHFVPLYSGGDEPDGPAIARTNIAVGKIDTAYLCALGPTAAASVPRLAWQDDDPKTDRLCTLTPPHIDGWRDWGFRNWRVLNSLAQQEVRP